MVYILCNAILQPSLTVLALEFFCYFPTKFYVATKDFLEIAEKQ